jgi:sorting nexin-1/2
LFQAERKALNAKHDFDRCSKLVKMEVARFEEERVKDFKVALEKFLEGMIERQKEVRLAYTLIVIGEIQFSA